MESRFDFTNFLLLFFVIKCFTNLINMIINMKTGNIDWMMNIDWIYYWVINDEYYLELLFGWVV